LTISRVGGADLSDIFGFSTDNLPYDLLRYVNPLHSAVYNNGILVNGGILYNSTGGGITFTYGSGIAKLTVGNYPWWGGAITNDNINYALQNITYSNTRGTVPSNLQFQYVFNDGSGTSTAITTGYISLNTINNNVPIVMVPVNTLSFASNTSLAFNNNSAISIIDKDGSSLLETVNLTVTNGTLCLNNLSGINIISGSNGTNNITFTGTIPQINAALTNLSYNPTFNYNGNAILNVILNYQNNAASSTITKVATINMQIYSYSSDHNVPPVINNPNNISQDAYTANSNTAVVINNNINIADQIRDLQNNGLGNYSNTIVNIERAGGGNYHDSFSFSPMNNVTVNENTLLSNGNVIACFSNLYGQLQIQFLNNGTIPTKALINEILQAVQYKTTDLNPSASINLVYTFDNGSGLGTASLATTTNSVNIIDNNCAPIINVAQQTQNIIQNSLNQQSSTVDFQGNISISDQYNISNAMETITLAAKHGILSFDSNLDLNLINVINNGNKIVATGTISDLNAALQTLKYISNNGYVGTDTIQLIVNNNNPDNQFIGNLLSSSYIDLNISQSVNQAPTSIAPNVTQYVNQNNNLIFNGNLSISDADAGNSTETITLTVNNGQLSFGNNTSNLINFTTESNIITATGTIAALNAALNGLIYTPSYGYLGVDQIKLIVNDNNNLSINGPLVFNNT
ncbi:MAG: beta strand repeat-containing protein, partial [Gammaproteobacteria bacterium]